MPGTKEGGRKAAQTNKQKDENFYANIGQKSWKDPNRSRKVGFALLDKETHLKISQKGGSKTKEEYQTDSGVAEEVRSNVSE